MGKLEYASQVFASLMHVADVLALSGASHITLCCDSNHKRLHHLALRMYDFHDLVLHELSLVESPKLRLLEDGEGLEAEVNVMLTDKEIDLKRKPDNGGDKSYSDVESMREDFASGALHPGDLKPALGRALNALLEPMRNKLKEEDALKKAVKDLEACSKAQGKKK